MANEREVLDALQDWITERSGAPVEPDASFLEGSGLDSFDVMELVIFAETKFKVAFSAADLQSAEFRTLSGLSRLIAGK
jgi:acyl carrier protein